MCSRVRAAGSGSGRGRPERRGGLTRRRPPQPPGPGDRMESRVPDPQVPCADGGGRGLGDAALSEAERRVWKSWGWQARAESGSWAWSVADSAAAGVAVAPRRTGWRWSRCPSRARPALPGAAMARPPLGRAGGSLCSRWALLSTLIASSTLSFMRPPSVGEGDTVGCGNQDAGRGRTKPLAGGDAAGCGVSVARTRRALRARPSRNCRARPPGRGSDTTPSPPRRSRHSHPFRLGKTSPVNPVALPAHLGCSFAPFPTCYKSRFVSQLPSSPPPGPQF